jgi:hypothetical protein
MRLANRSGPRVGGGARELSMGPLSARTGWTIYKSAARSRVLADAELQLISNATWRAGLHENFGTIVRLLVLTSLRRGEIAACRPSYINFETATLMSPTSESEKRPGASTPIVCANCGNTFEGRQARAEYRLHLSSSRECRSFVQRMVKIKTGVRRDLRD